MRTLVLLSCTVLWSWLVTPAIAGDSHWAFQPVRRPEVPSVDRDDWPRGDIDRFVLARLEAAGLQPAGEAAPEALLRRVTFDLAGRPPTLGEQQVWLASPDRAAWRAIVDRLLDSPEFGERWGQHWLDVARYAESSGGGRSLMFPEAWRYRDYVIASLNEDLSFDRFIVEQLAGDQLPYDDDRQRDRHVIATGFLTLGAINYEAQDKELLEMDIVDEQIDVIGRAFLGLSLGCARCHDHKFDPIETEEYYGLAGIFTSTKSVVHQNVGSPMTRALKHGEEVARYREYQARLATLQHRLAALKKERKGPGGESHEDEPADDELAGGQHAAESLDRRIADVENEIERFQREARRRPVAMGVVDADDPGDTHIRYGGDVHLRGPLAPRGFIAAAGLPEHMIDQQGRPRIPEGKSGRLELARWIASPDNRLTSRVIVNRVWHHLLGAGIVATTDDFGVTGRRPTHPELLDYLATTFVEEGWSIKSLVRRIALSRVYALSSDADEGLLAADPANELLGRARRRQLDAEALRDALLTVSDQLASERGGPTIAKLAKYDAGYQFKSMRRSVYVPRFRNVQPDVVAAFGGANPNTVTGCRAASILPTQALYLLNGAQVIRAAEETARRVLEACDDDPERLAQLYRIVLGRPPTTAEAELAQRYLDEMEKDSDAADNAEQFAWSGLSQLLLSSIDFRYLN